MDLTVGQTIGDYEVLGVLGSGGMGKVYKVRSIVSQRIEAIKILLPDLNTEPELAERFLREIRISAGLEHPNIASLHAAQQLGNQLLMVMEYVDGCTLGELMQKTRLPLDRSLEYISQALSALDYAHAQGVIHRDIKPGNIMITSAGQVKLMDFGIARLTTDSKLTKPGLMVGSVHYMSPEQIEGHEPDARSDIYSLGVTFYELVTGKCPFEGDSEYQIMAAHLKGAPQPPRELNQSLPVVVNELILTALARDIGSRFASAKAMRNAVTSIMQRAAMPTIPHQPQAPPPVTPVAIRKGHRALYMAVGSIATIAILIGAAIELPNFRRAKASGNVRIEQHLPSGQPPVAVDTSSPRTEPTSQAEAPQTEAPQAGAPQTAPAVETKRAPAETRKLASVTRQIPEAQTSRQSAHQKLPSRQTDSGATLHPVEAVTPVQEPPPAPAAKADDTEISALHDRMMLMSARVAAVRNSLQNLQNAQAGSGLGLRSDVVASEQRLINQISEAENRLNHNDASSARNRLDAAETELGKLESFLGK